MISSKGDKKFMENKEAIKIVKVYIFHSLNYLSINSDLLGFIEGLSLEFSLNGDGFCRFSRITRKQKKSNGKIFL